MIFRAAWSCFLVRKELLAEGRKDEENSHNTQASRPQPFGSLARKDLGQDDGLGVGGLWAWTQWAGTEGLGLDPYLLRGGRLPAGRRR